MTAGAVGRRGPRRLPKFIVWCAHHCVAICSCHIVSLITFCVYFSSAVVGFVAVVTTVCFQVSSVAAMIHATDMCVYCAARVPADGAEQAQRKMVWFRFIHVWHLPVLLAAVVAWIGSLTLWFPLLVAVAAEGTVWVYAFRQHLLLGLWCPWCRHRRGDDRAQVDPVRKSA